MVMFCDRFSECLCPVPAGGYASTAVLVRFVACLLPIRCRLFLPLRPCQIPIVRFNVLPFIGLQVPSTTNCQVSPSIVNDSDQLSINRLNQSITSKLQLPNGYKKSERSGSSDLSVSESFYRV